MKLEIIIIWLVAIYLGFCAITIVPTLLKHGTFGTAFSALFQVAIWAILVGLFWGILIVVISNLFPTKKSNKVQSDANDNKSINDSDEVI